MIQIKNGLVYDSDFTFVHKDLFIEKNIIVEPTTDTVEQIIDAQGWYVIPGLIDIHTHGACGHDFMEGNCQSVKAITEYEAAHGITSVCATTMTMPYEDVEKVSECAATYTPASNESSVEGIYMEGPFVSPQRAGAQNPRYLRSPDAQFVIDLENKYHNIKFVALAPELENGLETVRRLHEKKIRTAIAHTQSDFEQASDAIKAGANHVTHLFNAMPPFLHRNPGPIAAAADSDFCEVELICDGIHLHPAAVRAAFKMFDVEEIIFISDSMMATGLDDGIYSLGGLEVHMEKNKATLGDGTLAGSATNLFNCMVTAVKTMGIPLEKAIRCCTYNPAKSIGIHHLAGSLEADKRADLLFLDRELNLKGVMLRGNML